MATTAVLTAVENKTPDHSKDFTTLESKKLTTESFIARLAQANLASKNDIANFVEWEDFDNKLQNLNKKITSNKTKHVPVENEFKKLKTFDSSLSISQIYFNNDAAQL